MDLRAFPLKQKRVVLGVAGGIAAYKAAELLRLLVKAGADVRVILTRAAEEFVGKLTFQTLSGHPVATDLFDLGQESEIGHIKLADEADLFLVAPATADVIARFAAGLANDLLSTVALATRAPVLLAPSMNVNMWQHPIVVDNLAKLQGHGVRVVAPGTGWLACRWTGPGRLAEPADIAEAAGRVLTLHDLDGKRIVVSAGPTHELIDDVRHLANRSSGKMGFAVARAAAARGAEVTLVAGPTALAAPLGVDVVNVVSARDLEAAVNAHVERADAVIMAAAIADYRVARATTGKLKKQDLGDAPRLELVQNPDVLAGLGRARTATGGRRPVLVGFAAETRDLEAHAKAKLADKKCDLIVANDVSQPDAGFEVDTNRVTLVAASGVEHLPLLTKDEVAHAILDRVLRLLQG